VWRALFTVVRDSASPFVVRFRELGARPCGVWSCSVYSTVISYERDVCVELAAFGRFDSNFAARRVPGSRGVGCTMPWRRFGSLLVLVHCDVSVEGLVVTNVMMSFGVSAGGGGVARALRSGRRRSLLLYTR
jgi:hypothetical protein